MMGSSSQGDMLAVIAMLRDRPDPSADLGGGDFDRGGGEWEHETCLLEKFVIEFKGNYDFSSSVDGDRDPERRPTTQDNVYFQLFNAILNFRFLEGKWQQISSTNHRLVVLQSMRLLMRDLTFQRRFLLMGGGDDMVNLFEEEGSRHYDEVSRQGAAGGQYPLVHIASMLTKLEAEVLMHCCKSACYLLSTLDPYLLQCILILVHKVTREDTLLSHLCQGILQFPAGDGAVQTCEKLLDILQHQPKLEFRQLAAEALIGMSAVDMNRVSIVGNDGVKLLVGMLQGCEDSLLVDILTLLEILAMDSEASRQVRTIGGINIILNLLNLRLLPEGIGEGEGGGQTLALNRRGVEADGERHPQAVLVAGSSLLTQLSFDDDNSMHIRNLNGLFVLGSMLLYETMTPTTPEEEVAVQASALRTLRFLYSLERNRKSFKRVFPPSIFERFIEIGQYERNLNKYIPLASDIILLPADKKEVIRKGINEMIDHDADRRVGRYLILGDPIGKGGWGTVYRTRREGGQTHYALKEIPLEEGQSDDAETHKEVVVLKQAEHPNIVRYVDSFTGPCLGLGKGQSLYIVMELVEGSSLMELITSHIEKHQRIPEQRVRDLLVQICHALYYIHKKNITHRDIKPQNILLSSEQDVLTGEMVLRPILVDFGLAQERKSDHSMMTSFVGTLQYSCPEVVNRQPYTDKADIWSLGVISYYLVCLRNPFSDTNELQTARRIVEGDFLPIDDPEGQYSPVLKSLIEAMLYSEPDKRPDICEVIGVLHSSQGGDSTGERYGVQRADELYLKYQMLEARFKNLQAEKERDKERLESVMRGRRETMTRGVHLASHSLAPPETSGSTRTLNVQTPHTPGARILFSGTPASGYGRYMAQTPASKTLRSSRAPSIRVPALSVKEIDPATQLLNQLHRIVYVTQLPPTLDESADHSKFRRAIEKYKRALFSSGANGEGLNLKKEMSKLLSYSEEVIDVDFSGTELARVELVGVSPDKPGRFLGNQWSLTYDDMCKMLDELLSQHGYYDTGGSQNDQLLVAGEGAV